MEHFLKCPVSYLCVLSVFLLNKNVYVVVYMEMSNIQICMYVYQGQTKWCAH